MFFVNGKINQDKFKIACSIATTQIKYNRLRFNKLTSYEEVKTLVDDSYQVLIRIENSRNALQSVS